MTLGAAGDGERLSVTFFERATKAPESVFAGVPARSMSPNEPANTRTLLLVFKVAQRLGRNWHAFNCGLTLMDKVAASAI